jgi:hypothetical protein
MPYGTYTFSDLLAFRDRSIVEFGEDTILQTVQRETQIYNTRLEQALNAFVAGSTTDVQRKTGTGGKFTFRDAAELSRDEGQKAKRGETLGFPLKKKQLALDFSEYYFENQTPADIAERMELVFKADINARYVEVGRALFNAVNYVYFDEFVHEIDANVKGLYNGDGVAVPTAPGPVTFSGSHSHYLADTSLTLAGLRAVIATVREHNPNVTIQLEINNTNTDAVLALSSTAIIPAKLELINYGANITTATITQAANSDPNNRPVGVLDGAYVIHTKPYVPAGYALARVTNGGMQPLVWRKHKVGKYNGLRLAGADKNYPLRAEWMENYFGFGVYNRWSAAILQFNAAVDDTYQAPVWTEE